VSPDGPRPCPAIHSMRSWRTQSALVLVFAVWLPAAAQSLGDVARAERERQSKVQYHAPVLTDEDLGRDKILQKPRRDDDSAVQPRDNGNGAAASEDLPLGDYARALRQRRAAEPAPAAESAAKPAAEPMPAESNAVAHTPLAQPAAAMPDQKEVSLGDVAREARHEREAARTARMRDVTVQSAAQPTNATATTKSQRPDSSAQASDQAKSIRVPDGGSLWRLAQKYLGSGRLWTALWKANPQIRDPNRIRAGQLLHYPAMRDGGPGGVCGAGLSQPGGARVSSAPSAPAHGPATAAAAVLKPTRLGIRADQRLRNSLLSRPLSR
jgi:hypothetical protein